MGAGRDCKDHPGIDPNECHGGCSRNLLVTYGNVQQDGSVASAGEPDLADKRRAWWLRGTMLSSGAFDPDALKAMTAAYEGACTALDLVDRSDPLTEIIAQKIIERAKEGELDPVRLCEAVLEGLRSKR